MLVPRSGFVDVLSTSLQAAFVGALILVLMFAAHDRFGEPDVRRQGAEIAASQVFPGYDVVVELPGRPGGCVSTSDAEARGDDLCEQWLVDNAWNSTIRLRGGDIGVNDPRFCEVLYADGVPQCREF